MYDLGLGLSRVWAGKFGRVIFLLGEKFESYSRGLLNIWSCRVNMVAS